jgi:hypothetical protein
VDSESAIGEKEYAPFAFTREHLVSFAIISEEQILSFDPYQDLYEHAEQGIFEFAVKVGMNLGKIGEIFNVWLLLQFWTSRSFRIPSRFHPPI